MAYKSMDVRKLCSTSVDIRAKKESGTPIQRAV